MACCLFGAKPLPERMLAYCWLDTNGYISVKFYLKFKGFHTRKCMWKCYLQHCGHCLSRFHFANKVLIMMTSSNGNIFRVTGPLCGEFTGLGEFPTQRPVTRSFDVFFDLRLNKWLSKQWWGWWFETPSWSLWRQYNVIKSQQKHLPAPQTSLW